MVRENKIIEDIKKSKVCDVKLYGNLPHNEVPEYYSRSSIFLHASKYESFGLALVEAMASSLPIVSFNIGNTRSCHGQKNRISSRL